MEGDAPGGHPALLLHADLAGFVAAPHGLDKAAMLLLQGLGLLQRGSGIDMGLQVLLCLLVHTRMDQSQLLGYGLFQILQTDGSLFAVVPADQDALIVLQIAGGSTPPAPARPSFHTERTSSPWSYRNRPPSPGNRPLSGDFPAWRRLPARRAYAEQWAK